MNELTLTNIEDAVKVQAPVIEFDFESMKTALATRMEGYNAVAFGDDSSLKEQYQSMKADRVELNKAVKAIGSMDSSIRKKVLAPFEEYKAQSGELKNIIENVLVPLDEKVKDIEKYWRDEKLKSLKDVYGKLSVNVEEDFKAGLFDKIFSDSWTNQTTSLKKATAEMEELINRYVTGVSTVKSLNSGFEDEGISVLRDTLDVAKAVSKVQELNVQAEKAIAAERKRLEEQKQREIAEAERKAKEEAEAKARAVVETQLAKEREKAEAETRLKAEELERSRQQLEAERTAEKEMFAKEKQAFFANATNGQTAAPQPVAAVAAEGKTLIEVPTAALKMVTRYLDASRINYTIR